VVAVKEFERESGGERDEIIAEMQRARRNAEKAR
jgi:hypothetical protein